MEKNKSIDEIAREAINAIKKSERLKQLKEEEELIKRENALKIEVENRIKLKFRLLKQEQKKSKKNKTQEIDERFLVSWKNIDNNGVCYIGEYNDENVFKINRGINLFHLYVISNNILCEDWQKNSHTSISLDVLKKKADNILKKSQKQKK